jgi:hypothetical protein
MAARESLLLAAPCVLLFAACSSAPPPAARKAQEPPPAVSPQTVAPAPAPTPSTVVDPVPARVPSNAPVVIDEGTGANDGPQTLAGAAAAERERRRQVAPATLVINNKNLAEHATGKLTISQGQAPAATPAASAPSSEAVKDETYWRERVRGLRQQWALAVDSIGELEARAAGLRTRFYSEDDPYVRDGEVKPAWDKALEGLESARQRARNLEDQLGAALEEGRESGALPGWLRDGIELEPVARPYDKPERPVARDDANLVREPEELGKPPGR